MKPLPNYLIVFLALLAIPSIVSLFFLSAIGTMMFTSEPLTIPIAWILGADVTAAFSQFTSVSHWMIIVAGPLGLYALTQLLIVCWVRLIKSKLNWQKFRSRYIRGAIAGLPLLPLAMLIALADAPSSLVVSGGWLLLPLVIALGVEAALVRRHGSPGSDREGRR